MSRENFAAAPVIVAGAGPTGLLLATELRRGGVDVVLLDRRADRGVDGSRAAGMQPRTVELLDQRGVVDRFLAAGEPSGLTNFGGIRVDYARLPSRFPAINNLQAKTEQLLEEVAAELGVPVRWNSEVTGLRQDGRGVEVTVEGPDGTETVSGSFLVGCDGGRSIVRKRLGVGFPGIDASMVNLLGDVELTDPPRRPVRLERHEAGLITVLQFEPGWYRVVTTERERKAGAQDPVTIEELRASAERIAGTDFGMHSARWLSYFTDATRQAERYRVGRVLLAGDAAHIHPPTSGQGMSMGMQDAFNLGWKLAAVVRGEAPDALLDTYHDERHAADAEILHTVRAQSVLCDPSPRVAELVEVMTGLVGMPEVNDRLGVAVSGLGIRYQLPGMGAHPLLGRRVPDVDITTAAGSARVFELLRAVRPVLLDLSGKGVGVAGLAEAAAGWRDRIDLVVADCLTRVWPVPGAGAIPYPPALLIRPDGYVAWVSDTAEPDLPALRDSLSTWCGQATQQA